MNDSLERFYEDLDAAVGALVASGAWRLHCRVGCSGCCVDGLTVFDVEADHIRSHHEQLLAEETPHPEGSCAFLDEEGACRIYDHRPYVCRTQGLPLRWIEEDPEGEWVEMRDICPENEADCDLLTLEPEDCWLIGPLEERLANLQLRFGKEPGKRVFLRKMFRSQK